MEVSLLIVIIAFVIFLPFLMIGTLLAKSKKGSLISSAKFPPTFNSSLSPKEVLSVVEARLQAMQSIRFKWKTTEKVEKVGRLQSMLTVPYNLSGDNIRISFLMNLLATKKDAGGCTVEWNFVMMSPLSNTPPEIALLEDEIYKKTTLETRAALFVAQGDEEVAEFVQTQAQPARNGIEAPSVREPLKLAGDRVEVSPAQKQELFDDSLAPKEEQFEDAIAPQWDLSEASPAQKIEVPKKPEAQVVSNIPGTPLPDIVGEALKVVAGTTGDPSLMQTPEFQSVSLGGTPNPLNFSPPDPALSSGAASDAKCVKCSQARDPAFNFCLYCGHADA